MNVPRNLGLRALACSLAVSALGCAEPGPRTAEVAANATYEDVSLADLVGDPARYDRRLVRVSGVSQIQYGGSSLWANEQDKEGGKFQKGVWLDIRWPLTEEIRGLTGQWVVVEARFDRYSRGRTGCCRAMLADIHAIRRATP